MPAPTNNPLISSIPLSGPSFLLGEITNQFQPLVSQSMNVVIPTTLLGNEAKAGYAAITPDGVTVTRGEGETTLPYFVGFFANYNFMEGDVGSNPYTETLGGQFLASICRVGTIFVYNSTAISASPASGLKVVTSITTGTTPIAILIGSVVQGADPAGSTTIDISSVCKVRVASSTVGAGVVVDVLNA